MSDKYDKRPAIEHLKKLKRESDGRSKMLNGKTTEQMQTTESVDEVNSEE